MSPDRVKKRRQRGSSLTARPGPRRPNGVFYAVAEGAVTEYDYLALLQNGYGADCSFRIDMPARSSRRHDLTPAKVAEIALSVADSDARDGQYTEVWALFDRDEHGDVPEAFHLIEGHSKIKAAFSNPSFDFWLYLHFNLYDVPQAGSNAQIHSLLSQYGSFSGFGPKDKKITERRARELQPRIKAAVNNARTLDKRCISGRCTHERGAKPRCELLDRDPSSGMWRLLESLGVLPVLD